MGTSKKTKKDELIPTRRSVHVVYLSCPHCSHEMDTIELCPVCGEPMKVIDIVEKFGEDAERFLKRVEKRNGSAKAVTTDEELEIEKEEPNIILMGADDSLDDGGIDPLSDDGSLDVIFPDDDSSESRADVSLDDDLAKALDLLDSEDEENVTAEDFGFEDGEIPEL